MFDHDWTLFGLGPAAGVARLEALKTALGLGDPGQDNSHPFLTRLPSARLLDEWFNRIYTLYKAKWFLTEVCREAEQHGISRGESNAAVDFLRYRSGNLEEIINNNRPAFEQVSDWSRGLFQ